ncbi:MAG: beta-lactamase family protein, partial [Gammaproteobacteria bacterium]|nr:beta-lactamase family protein [Gammaproteobacteria bacterium]
GCRGKEHITLYQLLTHTAGLQLGPPPVSPEKMGNLEAVVAGICDSPVETVPGTSVHYSALCAHAIIAEMVRRVEGQNVSFREIMQRDLFEPLGMQETSLGRRADLASRVCPVVARYASEGLFDPAGIIGLDMLVTETAEIPAGGYVTSAGDMNIFANMLLNGGEWNGVRILSPAMINLIMTNQTGEKVNNIWSYTKATKGWDTFPANLGLGFFLRGEGIFPHWFGSMASPESFGGMGSGSTMFWVDPDKDLTFVFLSTGVIEDSDHILRCQRVSDLVHASLVS